MTKSNTHLVNHVNPAETSAYLCRYGSSSLSSCPLGRVTLASSSCLVATNNACSEVISAGTFTCDFFLALRLHWNQFRFKSRQATLGCIKSNRAIKRLSRWVRSKKIALPSAVYSRSGISLETICIEDPAEQAICI